MYIITIIIITTSTTTVIIIIIIIIIKIKIITILMGAFIGTKKSIQSAAGLKA